MHESAELLVVFLKATMIHHPVFFIVCIIPRSEIDHVPFDKHSTVVAVKH